MFDPESRGRLYQAIAIVLFAALGGLLGYLTRAADTGEPITLRQLWIKGAGAGFAGCLVFLACQAAGFDWVVTGILGGLAGWMGAEATIHILTEMVRKRLGLKPEAKEKRDDDS